MIRIILVLVLAGAISFGLTAWIKRMAERLRLLKESNERSLHTGRVPRGGGLAIVVVWYLGVTLFYWFDIITPSLFYALLCGLVLAGVSFLDDIIQVKPIIRLAVHFGVSIAAFIPFGRLRKPVTPGIDILSIPEVIKPAGCGWYGVVYHLYNFMDGADGFASVEAISIGLVLFVFTGAWNFYY
jgi:Fuc2NAc and GlcNAc transferase